MTTSREIRLRTRPHGWPTPENFELAQVELPAPAEGEVVVKNTFVSVDPYMRGRMNDVKSYVPPFELGLAMGGGAVGEVIASRAPALPVGAAVVSNFGWREAFVAPAASLQVVDRPTSDYLGVLGMTGMTAWVGLRLVDLKDGERVFISAAAGAVGMTAGQIAKQRGCYVVGSAGSADKVKMLVDELGFDAAFNYKDGNLVQQLTAAAPKGIDVYFDNVGGDHLEAALGVLRVNGRVAMCGAIAQYNADRPAPGPTNLMTIVGKRLTIRGFIVSDWMHQMPEFLAEMVPLVRAGKIKSKETVVSGIEHAPAAFLDLLRGGNVGKMVVKI